MSTAVDKTTHNTFYPDNKIGLAGGLSFMVLKLKYYPKLSNVWINRTKGGVYICGYEQC